jgi:hypothetical protein
MFTITGLLKVKKDTQKVTDTFQKREFVITDNSSQYPQHIIFQLVQDKCNLLDPVNEGEEITVSFNLRGREWTSPQGEVKFFNSLDAWRIEKATAMAAPQGAPAATGAPAAAGFEGGAAEDDLPF